MIEENAASATNVSHEHFAQSKLATILQEKGVPQREAMEMALRLQRSLLASGVRTIKPVEISALVNKLSADFRTKGALKIPAAHVPALPVATPGRARRPRSNPLRGAASLFKAAAVRNPEVAALGNELLRTAAVLAEAELARNVPALAAATAARLRVNGGSAERIERAFADVARVVPPSAEAMALDRLARAADKFVAGSSLQGDPATHLWRALRTALAPEEPVRERPEGAAYVKVSSLERRANMQAGGPALPLYCINTTDGGAFSWSLDEPIGIELNYAGVSTAVVAPEDSVSSHTTVRDSWRTDLRSDLPFGYFKPVPLGLDVAVYRWNLGESNTPAPGLSDTADIMTALLKLMPLILNPLGPVMFGLGLSSLITVFLVSLVGDLINELIELFGGSSFTPLNVVHTTLWDGGAPPLSIVISDAGSSYWEGVSNPPGPMPFFLMDLENLPSVVWAPMDCGFHAVGRQTDGDGSYLTAVRADVRAVPLPGGGGGGGGETPGSSGIG